MQATMVAGTTAEEEAIERDLKQLQGVWEHVAGRREAELIIAGDHFTFLFKQGAIYMGRFLLDPTKGPKWIDMRTEEGPSRYRGKTALGVYELDGRVLRWAAAEPGKDRPTTLPPDNDLKHLYIVFQRT